MSYKKRQVFVAVNLIQATYDTELPFAVLKELFRCFLIHIYIRKR